ncbi:MAG: Lipopolysaccharide assembly protein A [Candidatus Celerinatantimonas neptuna]|nr:MAG: Lipopolysaccharide assembly protein A [Candidatus Celerinatantimonas neptuna]
MKAIVILVVVIVLFIFALAIGSQNDQIISVHYLIADSQLRLSWLMAIMFISGFVIACVALGFFYSKARFQVIKLKRQLKKQQQKLAQVQQVQTDSNRD